MNTLDGEELANLITDEVSLILPEYGHKLTPNGAGNLTVLMLSAVEFFNINTHQEIKLAARDACMAFSESVPAPLPLTPLGKALALVLVSFSLYGDLVAVEVP